MVPTGLPEAVAQFTPTITRGIIPVTTVTVYQTIHQTVYATVLQTVRMPVTVTSYSVTGWAVTSSNSSYSVTGWTQSSSQMSALGPVGSSPGLGPSPFSAASLLGAGAVAGGALGVVTTSLLSSRKRLKRSMPSNESVASTKDELIDQIKNHLDMINQEMENAKKSLQIARDSVGDDAQLANVDMQTTLQNCQENIQQLSDILKMESDTALNTIRKIGG